jgi:hypothetical protein
MKSDDEIYQTTFYGTNLPNKALCRCHHPVRTDDGATAQVRSQVTQGHLKLKLTLSLNIRALHD